MSALWHHEQHRLGLDNMGFSESAHEGTRMSRSAPCSPMKAQPRGQDPLQGLLTGFEKIQKEAGDFHVVHKVPMGDSPYVRAKHVQLVDKDPEKAIALFWKAINANDRVDSALKDMAIVMKQQGRSEEAIEAIKSLRSKCSEAAQESLDNVLLDLYKRCSRLDDQIDLLKHKLNLIHQGLAFNGKRTKTARSQGKKFQVSIEQEATRLLGNLGWAYMQQNNFLAAEAVYRKALSIEPDNNKLCNLGICLMKQGRIDEARAILNNVTPAGEGKWGSESHQKSFERAQEMLREIESSQTAPDANRASYFQARAPTLLQLEARKNAQPQLQNVADALQAILSGTQTQSERQDEEILSLLPPSRSVTPPVFALPGELVEQHPPAGEHSFVAPVPRHQHPRPSSAPLQRQQSWRQNPPLQKAQNHFYRTTKQVPFLHGGAPFIPQKQGAAMPWGGDRYSTEQSHLPPQNNSRYSGPPPQQKALHRGPIHTSPLRPPAPYANAPAFVQNSTPSFVNRPQGHGVKSPASKALFTQSSQRHSPQEQIHTAAVPTRYETQPERIADLRKSGEALSRPNSAPLQTEPLVMPQPIRSVSGPRSSRDPVTRVSSPSKVGSPRRSFERLPSVQSNGSGRSSLLHSTTVPTEVDERPWESDHENENIPQEKQLLPQQGPQNSGVKRNRVLTPVKDNQSQEVEIKSADKWQSLGFSSSPLSFPKDGPVKGRGMFMAVLEAAASKEGGETVKESPRQLKGGSPQTKVEPKRQRRLRIFEEIAQEGM